MTATSAPLVSAARPAPALNHQAASSLRDSRATPQPQDHSFSEMLSERLRADKERSAEPTVNRSAASSAPSQGSTQNPVGPAVTLVNSNPTKPANSTTTASETATTTSAPKQLPAGNVAPPDQQTASRQPAADQSGTNVPDPGNASAVSITDDSVLSDANAANAAPLTAAAPAIGIPLNAAAPAIIIPVNAASSDSSSLLDQVLAGHTASTNGASILMAKLTQARVGIVNLPGQPQVKVAALEKKSAATNSADRELSIASAGVVSTTIPNLPADATPKDASATAGSKAVARAVTAGTDLAPASAAPAMTGHLAFALRLNAPSDSSTGDPAVLPTPEPSAVPDYAAAASPEASVTATSLAAMNSAMISSDSGKKEHSDRDTQDNPSAAAFIEAPGLANLSSEPHVRSETPVPAPIPLDDRLQEYSNDPVQNVQMQVIGEDNRRVDIRLLDRAGELRVSVKSGDSALNQTLQSKMPELTSRLQSAQYKTEVWMPASTQSSDSSTDSNDQEQDGQQQRPAWVEDLEGATPHNTERNF